MATRTTYALGLEPVAGSRFQPTGFPDLGAAGFQRPDGKGGWVEAIHVESPQSMANRAEATTWDSATATQKADLNPLPYVRVVDKQGDFLTSSRLEAHRLASAYIREAVVTGTQQSGQDWLASQFGLVKGRAMDYRQIAQAIYRIDPLSLLHGVFFAVKSWPWQPKIARAVTAFIDADDVREAVSGGVKTDSVDSSGGHTETGYGMVPHQRVEYTAQTITAYVTVDHEQIASYGLNQADTAVMNALVDYELAHLLNAGSLRLRTACDLRLIEGEGNSLLKPEQAADRLREALDVPGVTTSEVTTVTWAGRKEKTNKAAKEEE